MPVPNRSLSDIGKRGLRESPTSLSLETLVDMTISGEFSRGLLMRAGYWITVEKYAVNIII
ncbi:hypothetical protein [Natronincola ferrireducens]|uniref:hypothetical protein n=1 Tax=Natronincola ferrireducens TaxID=393762 RepID=UPI0015A3506A|nr:hypothetical protein [Natronincola ferrireducens]